ncbi:MAG TPA: hypothetical protein VFT49_02730 [Candidatus Saccharimonadales bacterium]|nr:hypothetical protein [Candidatus Saccharimonadales bacterium]
MSKRLLVAGFVLAMAVALAANAAAAKGKPSSAALRVQKSLTVTINKTTNYVTASGWIKRGGKKIAVKSPAYVVTRSDSSGNTCGSAQTGSGSKLKLQVPGAFKAAVTLRSKLKYNGKYLSITKMVSADLGGDQLECAKLTTAPSASAVCAWGVADPVQPCGVPVLGRPAWLTPPQMEGGSVYDGSFASSSTFCWKYTKPASGVTWMGLPIQPMEWKCADGEVVAPFVYVWLTHPNSTDRCSETGTPLGQVENFQVPPDLGGTLYVTFELVFPDRSMELSNAVFKLNGKEDGCAQLTSHG